MAFQNLRSWASQRLPQIFTATLALISTISVNDRLDSRIYVPLEQSPGSRKAHWAQRLAMPSARLANVAFPSHQATSLEPFSPPKRGG